MHIETLRFKAGSSPAQPGLTLGVAPITVFVGPNYSGKSQAIAEIAARCSSGNLPPDAVILDDVAISPLNSEAAQAALDSMRVKAVPGEIVHPQHEIFGRRNERFQATTANFLAAMGSPNTNDHLGSWFAQWYGRFQILMLNGGNRIGLINDQHAGDMQSPPTSSFQQIFRKDELRARLSEIVHRAFGLYLVVDPTALGQLRLRLSKIPPPAVEIERGLTDESVKFHGEATALVTTSDGAKAFVGIMSEILAGNPDILLMDEPEAFLHPALASMLGKEIAQEVSAAKKQMFVSTHSPQFLMGCIQSGVDINVVRLTYRDGVSTARLLPSDELRKMMRNPLLRSTGVISALFYESVIVTEADPDRAFYQEINERLLREDEGRGIPSAIFLNAQNKQTIPTILRPLRALGIPAAAIYDIDLIKDGGSTATSFLSSAGVPDLSQQSLTGMRASLHEALKATGKNFKTQGGIDLLSGSDRQAATDYLDTLKAYGAFVVPGGELEHWLQELGVHGHGPGWLIPMFERLGEDLADPNYVQPGTADVWGFIDEVRAWLQNPSRKGIPA